MQELGHRPQDAAKTTDGDAWALQLVLPPDGLEVVVRGEPYAANVVLEAFSPVGMEAVISRRGADVAHKLRAAIERRRTPDLELEMHRNGKAWLRSTIGAEELRKDVLGGRIEAIQKENALILRWVSDALLTGTLPR